MTESIFGKLDTWTKLSKQFVEDIMKTYHYNEFDEAEIIDAATEIRNCIRDQAAYEIALVDETKAYVALSLGKRLDILLDRYSRTDKYIKQLATEHIASKLLMDEYESVCKVLTDISKCELERMIFFGDSDEYPLSMMPEVLAAFDHLDIACDSNYSLVPSKSVCFAVILSDSKCKYPTGEKTFVHNCANCIHRKNGSCNF